MGNALALFFIVTVAAETLNGNLKVKYEKNVRKEGKELYEVMQRK